MKKKKFLVIFGLFFLLGYILYFLFNQFLRSGPYERAKNISGLDISKNIRLISYDEKYSETGEGYVYICFKLKKNELNYLKTECQKKDYKTLSIKNLIKDGFLNENPNYGINLHKHNIRNIKTGYYLLRNNDLKTLDYEIIVLDCTNNELIIYVSFP
jgi:hypothetical protein